jgi:hypothetical protein
LTAVRSERRKRMMRRLERAVTADALLVVVL